MTSKLPDGFLDELKSRLRVSDVVGRKVKLKRQGKEWVGLSPFTSEKTPSFYAIDEKRIWHCFSSGKSGDIIAFVMETENLTFMEAVEVLADQAGLSVPKADPQAQAQQDKRERLYAACESAAVFFEAQLRSGAGAGARAYLHGRGLDRDAWARYRLGYAPDGWTGLIDHLTSKGFSFAELVEAGLAVQKDGRSDGYDRFRDRVIFPIEDIRGRVVAFGGRAIGPDAKPKYLNSSETPLFHKGQQLYNFRNAKRALAETDKAGLIVAEGYMDVIALAEAGFGMGVAPLGTALTEDQLRLIWQAGSEPKLCFDGDAAGLRAAYKAVDRALPFLEPGKSLFFALMPEGYDPDDLVREQGPAAMGEVLGAAMPLVDLLWMREVEREPLNTPERQAGLVDRLNKAVADIANALVRRSYERELRARANELFFQLRRMKTRPAGEPGPSAGPMPKAAKLRGLGLIVRCVETPDLLDRALEALAAADFPDADVVRLRDAIFDVIDACGKVDRVALKRHLRNLGGTRSVELLDSYPKSPPLDLNSAEGREWQMALEQFAADVKLREETRHVRGDWDEEDADVVDFAERFEARRRLVAERHALRAQAQEAALRADHG